MAQEKQNGVGNEQPNPTTQSFLPEIMISICGAGDLIHARFQVDSKMKLPGPIYLQDESTGKICVIAVTPKIGPLMSSRKKPGNYAFCVFNNNDDSIKVGSPVTLIVGEFRREHLIPVI
jgi:hypothetical protein